MVENTQGEFNKGKSRKKVRGLRMIRAASPRIPSHIGGSLTGRSLAFSSFLDFVYAPASHRPSTKMLSGKLKAKQSQHSAEELQKMQAELFAKARQKLYADK